MPARTTILNQILAVLLSTAACDAKALIITDDFGGVLRCKDANEIAKFCSIIISAKPDILALDAASPDVTNYPTKVATPLPFKQYQELAAKGLDPYGMVCRNLNEAGIEVVANIRMNDHHGQPEVWTDWEKQNTQWSLGRDTGDRSWSSIGMLRRMDYAVPQVRAYRLAIIKEILEKYPVTGIQLDFGRTAPFVSEPKIQKSRYITEFIQDVRNLLDSKNKCMVLGVIVPWDLKFCINEGLDITTWAQKGLVNYISPAEFFYGDYNLDIKSWSQILKGTSVKLYPIMVGDLAPHRVPGWTFQKGNMPMLGESSHLTSPRITAFAELFYSQGAHGVSMYNFYTFNFGKLYPSLKKLVDPANIKSLEREYFFCRKTKFDLTENYNFKTGEPFELLKLSKAGDLVKYKFLFGSDMNDVKVTFSFHMKYALSCDQVSVFLNQHKLTGAAEYKSYTDSENVTYNVGVWQSKIRKSGLIRGENIIEIELVSSDNSRVVPVGAGNFKIVLTPQGN